MFIVYDNSMWMSSGGRGYIPFLIPRDTASYSSRDVASPGGKARGPYNAGALSAGQPAMLVEGELDAQTIELLSKPENHHIV